MNTTQEHEVVDRAQDRVVVIAGWPDWARYESMRQAQTPEVADRWSAWRNLDESAKESFRELMTRRYHLHHEHPEQVTVTQALKNLCKQFEKGTADTKLH